MAPPPQPPLRRPQIPPPTPDRPYIADFACLASRLIIEADGGQHADNPADLRRTAWLEAHGWRVLRFWNTDVLTNPEAVMSAILAALHNPTRHATRAGLSRERERRSPFLHLSRESGRGRLAAKRQAG